MQHKIVVLDGYTLNPGDNPWTDIAQLGDLTVYERTSPEQIVERSRGADIILTNKTLLSAQTLQLLEGLKFISVLATGYNVVDVPAAGKLGIAVSNVPIYGTNSVAQFVFALLLDLCHHVARHSQLVHEGQWHRRGEFSFWEGSLVELAGKKIGLAGLGRIGQRVGQLANAFGMEVIAYDLVHGHTPSYKPFRWASMEEVFKEADVVSMHCPLTEQNKGIVDKKLLGLMKEDAFFINTSRGALVNEADLAQALTDGTLAAAAVDVVCQEPIAADNPLLFAPNCLITPHIAWATLAARKRLTKTTAENIAAFIQGKPINVVN